MLSLGPCGVPLSRAFGSLKTMITQETLYFTRELRLLWPRPLAGMWLKQYPHLFDEQDDQLATNQPNNHFCEWFVAAFDGSEAVKIGENCETKKSVNSNVQRCGFPCRDVS